MSELYKKEDVIEFLNLHCPKDMWEYQIEDLPSVDIVHCKECKWAGRDEHCPAIEVHMICGADGYCSCGESEEQEND